MTGPAVRSLLMASAMAACGGVGALDRVPEGPWGGEHVALLVRGAGAAVRLDCAHGEITVPLRLEPDGNFRLPGYYVRDVGPALESENRLTASYFGRFDGRVITLSFALLEDGLTEGPFTASPGAPAQLQECR